MVEPVQGAAPVDAPRFDEHVGGLAAMGAGIHAQRPAHRAGDAAIEGEPVEGGLGGGLGEAHVGYGGAGRDRLAVDGHGAEGLAAEPHRHAGNAAVAHDEVRAEADHRDRHGGIEDGEQGGEVFLVGGGEQHLRRAADAEPRQVGEARPRDEPAPEAGRGGADRVVEGV